MTAPDTLVLCIGNPARGDDAAGSLVAAALSVLPVTGVLLDLVEDFQLQPEHVEDMAGRRQCIIVDAALQAPWPPTLIPILAPQQPGAFSHALSPMQLAWLHAQRFPGCALSLSTLGIPARQFELGAPPTPFVREAIPVAVALLLKSIGPHAGTVNSDGSVCHA